LRKLVEGGTNRSYGIQVARLAGLPEHVIKRAKKILYNIENRENKLNGFSIQPDKRQASIMGDHDKQQVQLNLFRQPETFIIEKLQQLDISKTTPIEALNYLNELKEKLKM